MTAAPQQRTAAADRPAAYPPSYAQESFLAGGAESAVNVPSVVRLPAGTGPGPMVEWLAALATRHGALRTILIRDADGRVQQRVLAAAPLPLTVTEHGSEPAGLLADVLLAGSEAPFPLVDRPLARAELHTLGADGSLLLLWLHHAVTDLVSSQLLAAELGTLAGGGSLAPPELQMADFAVQERGVRATVRQREFWTDALRDADDRLGVGFPAGTPHQAVRPALPRLPGIVVDRLGRLAAAQRTTVTTVLAAAVVAAHSAEVTADRCVIGLTISNRDHPRLRPTVGCLADQIPLVVDLTGRPTFRDLVGRVREALLDAYDHRLPLGLLLPLLGRPASPVFAVNLNFLPPPAGRARGPRPPAGPDLPYGITKVRPEPWWLGDASLAYRPRVDAAGLAGEVEGDAHLEDADGIRRRGERFCALLTAVSTNPDLDVRVLAGAAPQPAREGR